MADYGIRVIGSHGAVQVDQDHKNLELRAKATVATTTNYPGTTSVSTVDVTYTGPHPLMALRCAVNATILRQTISGSTWTFQIVVDGIIGTSVDYWIFDEPDNAAPSGYGVVVFDENEEVTFNSNKKYIRVVDFFTDNDYDPDTRTYTSGRTYGFIPVFSAYRWQQFNLPDNFYQELEWTYGGRNATNGVQFQTMIVRSEVLAGQISEQLVEYNYGFIVIDLTDI